MEEVSSQVGQKHLKGSSAYANFREVAPLIAGVHFKNTTLY